VCESSLVLVLNLVGNPVGEPLDSINLEAADRIIAIISSGGDGVLMGWWKLADGAQPAGPGATRCALPEGRRRFRRNARD
jgi:hypothetical protein